MSKVYFGGGRHCSTHAIINQVVEAVLKRGAGVSVGCAIGADALVIQSVVSQGKSSSLFINAAFASNGAGSFCGSAVQLIKSVSHVANISWLAGGSLSVPLPARLFRRSIAGLHGSSCAIFFNPASGSLKVAGYAINKKIPVYVFSSSMPSLPFGCVGQWLQVRLLGFICWRWCSA